MPRITVAPTRPLRTIPNELFYTNIEWFNPVNTLQLPVHGARFPGGTTSDTYHWQTPLGTPQKLYTKGPDNWVQYHDFNTDKLLALGKPALITVNALSTPEEAAAWVKAYPQIRFWEIGNEVYYKDDLSGHLTIDQYVNTVKLFSRAMRAANPNIKILGIGNISKYSLFGDNDETWVRRVANETDIDFIALHHYNMADASYINAVKALIPERVNIAITEWGPLHQLEKSNVDTLYSAMEVAESMMVMIKDPRVQIACFFKHSGDDIVSWYDEYGSESPALKSLFLFHFLGRELVKSESTLPHLATKTGVLVLNKTNAPITLTVAGINPRNYLSLTSTSWGSTDVKTVAHNGRVLPARSITVGMV